MKTLAIFFFTLLISACGTKTHLDMYNTDHVGAVYKVVKGTVLSARVVNIQASQKKTETVMSPHPADIWQHQNTIESKNQFASERFIPQPSPSIGTEYIIESQGGSIYALIETGRPEFDKGDDVLVIFGKAARVVSDPSG